MILLTLVTLCSCIIVTDFDPDTDDPGTNRISVSSVFKGKVKSYHLAYVRNNTSKTTSVRLQELPRQAKHTSLL